MQVRQSVQQTARGDSGYFDRENRNLFASLEASTTTSPTYHYTGPESVVTALGDALLDGSQIIKEWYKNQIDNHVVTDDGNIIDWGLDCYPLED
ncbi:hypothetical protein ACRE_029510 [Hapsidospora chrysogenum ATCC 11550]|uniref:Uncharacterized protein n=1 Tax=Hapsidospora chrysogenum (strain ATCC 11550 / CBS 779.69 / DSM 880 / IAM 14645 / JCM 23072 / IMI 49137) TaxID=857340 RepID=A0A086TAB3_HAPC1|nr:hypothetical protein ACRE_029510 [Hapsidospora chrysogenum ATCC 11550]